MLKIVGCVIAAFAVVMLGIEAQQKLFKPNQTAQAEVNRTTGATYVDGNAEVPKQRPQSLRLKELVRPTNPNPSQSSSLNANSSTLRQLDSAATQQSDMPQSQDTVAAVSDPVEVIGRAFPVSASVIAACIKSKAMASCDDEVVNALSKMAQEPRDLTWALEVETRLRKLINSQRDEFTVRNVECRTSLCAVEVASIYGPYHGFVDDDKWLDNNIKLWSGMHGYEQDSAGAKITVSLRLYQRR